MALVYSSMMELGTQAPDFELLDTISGKVLSLHSLKSESATVVMFICNHCPFVVHINSKLVEVAKRYQAKGIQFIAINSNSIETHPQDGPQFMPQHAKNVGYSFPYFFDETQQVAKAYGAECTPDFFVFDKNLKCTYRGRFDETRPNMGQSTGKDLSETLEAMLTSREVNKNQLPSMGCNIKWRT